MNVNPGLLLAFGLLLLVGACTTTLNLQENPADYRQEIQALQVRLAADQNDTEALRDLGGIYVRTQQYEQGRPYLQRAYAADSLDAMTTLYLGLAREMTGDATGALALYRRYPEVSGAAHARLMASRFRTLAREQARITVRALLSEEEQLNMAQVTTGTVGVFALNYRGAEVRYEPLGRGLSEMLMIDLAKVDSLTVVERVRLQAVLDELAFSQRSEVDPSSAPRLGRLLGAGTVVGGGFDIVGGEAVQLDVAAFDVVLNTPLPDAGEEGPLRDLFDLEKAIVFRVVEGMGIDLTEAEQVAIQFVPTRNLEAFLAFSQGLVQEDAGNLRAARQHYQRAASLDPGFGLAGSKVTEMTALEGIGGSTSDLLSETIQLDGQVDGTNTQALVDNRLQNLGEGIGSVATLPSPETRDPAQEAAVGEMTTMPSTLPRPPAPPGGNN